ncbi:sialate O-acetylesterase [Planctomycetota bacterium]
MKKYRTTLFEFLCLVIFLLHATSFGVDTSKKVKVFILAGQSNMEGKAKVELLEYQINEPETRDFFRHFKKEGLE